jgi:hypothetical protein
MNEVHDTAMTRFGGSVFLQDTAGGYHGIGPIHDIVRLEAIIASVSILGLER